MELDRKQVISWSFYDWANSAFATSVMAGFFPVFFKHYWSAGVESTVSTFHLGTANSLASLFVALTAPLFGAIADKGGTKKKFLLFFALMGIVMTGSLCFVAQGEWKLAVALYIFAIVGFAGGNIFYDALLVGVAPDKKRDFVSALGYSFGYLGGGLLFALNVVMVLFPHAFGFHNENEAMRISSLSVAIWWGVFSIPLFVFVKEPKVRNNQQTTNVVFAGFRQIFFTFKKIRKLRMVFLFLLGYWLYIDGVDTIIRMAVDYGLSLGLTFQDLVLALLLTQFVGFPAAIVFGRIGEKWGAKKGILIGLGIYLGVTIWGSFIKSEAEFYILAVIIGLVQGGVQALSRSFYARLIPKNQAAEFFGFYNMLGKFAAVIGPLLMGWLGLITGNPRYAILSIGLLFVGGGLILYLVNEREGQRVAKELEGNL